MHSCIYVLIAGLHFFNTFFKVLGRYRDCHIVILKALQDQRAYGPQWTNKQVTQCLINHRDEYKYNVEAVELLIRSHLVNMQQYDQHLAQVAIFLYIFTFTKMAMNEYIR